MRKLHRPRLRPSEMPTGKLFKDRTGLVYHNAKVVEYAGVIGKHHAWWCSCTLCGSDELHAIASGSIDQSGMGKSCTCSKAQPEDITGLVSGRLVVRTEAGKCPHNNRQWVCDCECGNRTVVSMSSLKAGTTKSCGCLVRERRKSK